MFVGSSAGHASTLRKGELRNRLHNFETVYQASAFLAATTLGGELIYVKGSGNEHLERIMLSVTDRVVCWKEKCGEYWPCPRCKHYAKPARPPFGVDFSPIDSGQSPETANRTSEVSESGVSAQRHFTSTRSSGGKSVAI